MFNELFGISFISLLSGFFNAIWLVAKAVIEVSASNPLIGAIIVLSIICGFVGKRNSKRRRI